jgi:hypothetical protein
MGDKGPLERGDAFSRLPPRFVCFPRKGNTLFGMLDRDSRQHHDREASVQTGRAWKFGPGAFANPDGEMVVVDGASAGLGFNPPHRARMAIYAD